VSDRKAIPPSSKNKNKKLGKGGVEPEPRPSKSRAGAGLINKTINNFIKRKGYFLKLY